MEEEILDIKRENYKLRKENFELIQDNTKLQEDVNLLNYKLREKICMEAHSQFKELQENSIPKSKVKEKLEELRQKDLTVILCKRSYGKTFQQAVRETNIQLLEELLGDKYV